MSTRTRSDDLDPRSPSPLPALPRSRPRPEALQLALGTLAALALLFTAAPAAQLSPGEVLDELKISQTEGGFTGALDDGDRFGNALAALGDLDGNHRGELAVGARLDDDGGTDRGAVWVLFLEHDGSVMRHQKISSTEGNFTGLLDNDDLFGQSTAALGDLNGDGIPDLAVGANRDDDGGPSRGAVWILFLDHDGTVKGYTKISDTEGDFTGVLDDIDYFGMSVTAIGDLDADGVVDLAVGALGDDDGGPSPLLGRGAVWILFMTADGTVREHQKISATAGGFTGTIGPDGWFGLSVAPLGDLDRDGVLDLAVGTPHDDDGGNDRGAVYLLFLRPDGTVKATRKISDTEGNFTGVLDDDDRFGNSLASLGDFDGDEVPDLAVGADLDDDGSGGAHGAVWMLFLTPEGTVKSHQKISQTEGQLTGPIDPGDGLGASVAFLGDFDHDGRGDIAVGATGDDDGGGPVTNPARGAVWMLFLNARTWFDIDFCLPGTFSCPELSAQSTLVGGDPITLTLLGARPLSTAWLCVGVDPLLASFKGGILVPDINPPGFYLPLPTGTAGSIVINDVWPPGIPSGFQTYYQYWIEDPVGPVGFAASNALQGTTP